MPIESNPAYRVEISDIINEFGQSGPPYLLSDYYRGGAYTGNNVSYSNYSTGISGNGVASVPTSGMITLNDFRGTAKSKLYTWGSLPTGHPSSGYSSSNSTSFSLLSYFSSSYVSTGDTFLVGAELHPSTPWKYAATNNCILAITIGTSSSLTVPLYYGKQWRMYVSYDGLFGITIGGYYQGSSTGVPQGGAWLQGIARTGT